jgi:hypothetical protein
MLRVMSWHAPDCVHCQISQVSILKPFNLLLQQRAQRLQAIESVTCQRPARRDTERRVNGRPIGRDPIL